MANRIRDLSGLIFGRLTVLKLSGNKSKAGNLYWLCKCTCGTLVEIVGSSLTRKGSTLSCGCYSVEVSIKVNTKHGHAKGVKRKETAEYSTWNSMWTRCTNEKSRDYPDYGGRGIQVCKRWAYFKNFIEDMGLKHGPGYQIDRKNNNKNYTPKNCRWVTKQVNINNRRNTQFLTYRGATLPLSEWAKKFSIGADKLRRRIARGWSVHKALTEK